MRIAVLLSLGACAPALAQPAEPPPPAPAPIAEPSPTIADEPESPQTAGPRPNVLAIAAAGGHACARIDDGTVRCWGANHSGQLGDGTHRHREIPVVVRGLAGAKEIALGGFHACALLESGDVSCWGWNPEGALGDGTFEDRPTPVRIDLARPRAISLGERHSCAIGADGAPRCWGGNACGELGSGERFLSLGFARPHVVPALRGVEEIAAGRRHTCVRMNDGTVRCWGANSFGELGSSARDLDPVARTRMSPPSFPSLAARPLGTSWAPCPASSVPVVVPGLRDVAQLAAGSESTCARMNDGTVRCWGLFGPPETSSEIAKLAIPRIVPGVHDAIDLRAGSGNACALIRDGSVMCWGNDTALVARRILGLPPVVAAPNAPAMIAIGGTYSCALANHDVTCWGSRWTSAGEEVAVARPTAIVW